MNDENSDKEKKQTGVVNAELPTSAVSPNETLQLNPTPNSSSTSTSSKDSFNVPVKKSPLLLYALLQIPLVLFMVILLYFMYQAKQD